MTPYQRRLHRSRLRRRIRNLVNKLHEVHAIGNADVFTIIRHDDKLHVYDSLKQDGWPLNADQIVNVFVYITTQS